MQWETSGPGDTAGVSIGFAVTLSQHLYPKPHNTFICVTWLICMCDMTRTYALYEYVRHVSARAPDECTSVCYTRVCVCVCVLHECSMCAIWVYILHISARHRGWLDSYTTWSCVCLDSSVSATWQCMRARYRGWFDSYMTESHVCLDSSVRVTWHNIRAYFRGWLDSYITQSCVCLDSSVCVTWHRMSACHRGCFDSHMTESRVMCALTHPYVWHDNVSEYHCA